MWPFLLNAKFACAGLWSCQSRLRTCGLREAQMTFTAKVSYVVTGLAFLYVGAITVGLI